jgi:hypothetical protein
MAVLISIWRDWVADIDQPDKSLELEPDESQ